MPQPDRATAERLHAIVTEAAPAPAEGSTTDSRAGREPEGRSSSSSGAVSWTRRATRHWDSASTPPSMKRADSGRRRTPWQSLSDESAKTIATLVERAVRSLSRPLAPSSTSGVASGGPATWRAGQDRSRRSLKPVYMASCPLTNPGRSTRGWTPVAMPSGSLRIEGRAQAYLLTRVTCDRSSRFRGDVEERLSCKVCWLDGRQDRSEEDYGPEWFTVAEPGAGPVREREPPRSRLRRRAGDGPWPGRGVAAVRSAVTPT